MSSVAGQRVLVLDVGPGRLEGRQGFGDVRLATRHLRDRARGLRWRTDDRVVDAYDTAESERTLDAAYRIWRRALAAASNVHVVAPGEGGWDDEHSVQFLGANGWYDLEAGPQDHDQQWMSWWRKSVDMRRIDFGGQWPRERAKVDAQAPSRDVARATPIHKWARLSWSRTLGRAGRCSERRMARSLLAELHSRHPRASNEVGDGLIKGDGILP